MPSRLLQCEGCQVQEIATILRWLKTSALSRTSMLSRKSCRSISHVASLSGAISVQTMQMTALTTMAACIGKEQCGSYRLLCSSRMQWVHVGVFMHQSRSERGMTFFQQACALEESCKNTADAYSYCKPASPSTMLYLLWAQGPFCIGTVSQTAVLIWLLCPFPPEAEAELLSDLAMNICGDR